MKTIRHTFESNSSSSHSLSLNTKEFERDNSFDNLGLITLNGGEFGWEWCKYNDAWTKTNYFIVYHKNDPTMIEMLKDVIQKESGAFIEIDISDDCYEPNWSYIDHQSLEKAVLEEIKTKEDIRNFIFNKKTVLITGNDNECAPYGFLDDIRKPKANYILKIGDKKYYIEELIYDNEVYIFIPFHAFREYLEHSGFDWDYQFEELEEMPDDYFSKNRSGTFSIIKMKYEKDKGYIKDSKHSEANWSIEEIK